MAGNMRIFVAGLLLLGYIGGIQAECVDASSCHNRGVCGDSGDCVCDDGFSGFICEHDCSSDADCNGGTCLLAEDPHICKCPEAQSGIHCEIMPTIIEAPGSDELLRSGRSKDKDKEKRGKKDKKDKKAKKKKKKKNCKKDKKKKKKKSNKTSNTTGS